jgi:hypothetical protein
MPKFHLKSLDRNAYIDSVNTIADERSVRFATMSMKWWDRHFSWRAQGCTVLCDDKENHLCYLFYKIDRYNRYLTIHNIFTPLARRREGYAHELLKMVFELAIEKHVKRFKLDSISKSLDFYLALGFVYWGVNSVGDYYCDLPIPTAGLATLGAMVKRSDVQTLVGGSLEKIYAKVNGNDTALSCEQTLILDSDKQKMQGAYMLNTLLDARNDKY